MSPADPLSSMNTPIVQYIEVLLALAGVLVLAYVTLKVGLPRMFGMRPPGRGPIQVVARYALEPRKTLYLVQTGSQVLLLGTSENQVQYLTALEAENAAEILQSVRSSEPPRQDFRALLNRFQGIREKPLCNPPAGTEAGTKE
jgi:flagellar biogenesis protein FliO